MYKFIGFSCLLICGFHLRAETFYHAEGESQSLYQTHQNGAVWYLEQYQVNPHNLQERVQRHSFVNFSQLSEYIKQHQLKVVSQLDWSKLDLPQTEVDKQVIWKATQEWNLDWEKKYSDWVNRNFTQDFFVRYKLATDCADVAYALRWIFARINSLPAANTLAGSGVLFSNESVKKAWVNLPTHELWYKDQKFLAALHYLFENTFTETLINDLYPIKISKAALTVGTIQFLGDHTLVVSEINRDLHSYPIKVMSSTVPSDIREMNVELLNDTSGMSDGEGGIMKLRWPVKVGTRWKLVNGEKMPYFSKEQYGDEFINGEKNFILLVFDRLQLHYSGESLVKKMVSDLYRALQRRITIVEQGFNICHKTPCLLGTSNYENWSTPSRDAHLRKAYRVMEDVVDELDGLDHQIDLEEMVQTELEKYKFTLDGTEYDASELLYNVSYRDVSSDPNASMAERWGL